MAVIAPRGRAGARATAPTRALVSWGWAAIEAADVEGAGALHSQPPSLLPLPPLLACGAGPIAESGGGGEEGREPWDGKGRGRRGGSVSECHGDSLDEEVGVWSWMSGGRLREGALEPHAERSCA